MGRERGPIARPSGECEASRSKDLREGIAGKICVFLLAQSRQRIELAQLGVHETGMRHDHSLLRKPIEEMRKEVAVDDAVLEIVSAGKCRIGSDAESLGATADASAEQIEHETLAIAKPLRGAKSAAALAHPGCRRLSGCDLEHRLADLRKQMRVLMAVDERGPAAENLDEPAQLGRHLRVERNDVEPVQACPRAQNP